MRRSTKQAVAAIVVASAVPALAETPPPFKLTPLPAPAALHAHHH